MTEDSVETLPGCASCGQPLTHAYCGHCGEEALDRSKLTARYFLTRTVPNEILNLDGKIWRTLLLLLFRPGFLALEYVKGRRRPYVNPLRVLIVAIVAYVLATQGGTSFTFNLGPMQLSTAPTGTLGRSMQATMQQVDRFGILESMFTERFGPVADASDQVETRFNRTLNGFATPLSFTAVFLVALTLYTWFHRRRPLYVEHAVFSMHYYSFLLLSLAFVAFVMSLRLTSSFAFAIVLVMSAMAWQVVYLAIGIRRFYFAAARWPVLAWIASAAIAVIVNLLSSLYITAIQFAGGALAIARL
jgi:hypothetical protein